MSTDGTVNFKLPTSNFQGAESQQLPRLEGTRIDLRWVTVDDAPALFRVFGDAEVMRFWSAPPLQEARDAIALVEDIHRHFRGGTLFQWGVSLRGNGHLIGTCTLHHIDLAHKRAEVGFALARQAWGQGMATEALTILLRYAFDSLGLHRIEADVDPDNERSIRALERQGFQREGYLRQRWHHLGDLRDTVFLGLLRPEWTPSFRAE